MVDLKRTLPQRPFLFVRQIERLNDRRPFPDFNDHQFGQVFRRAALRTVSCRNGGEMRD